MKQLNRTTTAPHARVYAAGMAVALRPTVIRSGRRPRPLFSRCVAVLMQHRP